MKNAQKSPTAPFASPRNANHPRHGCRQIRQREIELKERLDDLRDELDGYLAEDYGVKIDNEKAYTQWRDSHQPFHWFVEFYGIMSGGGFDVIIGNPPYVSTKRIAYKVFGSSEEKFSDIYGHVLSKSLALTIREGRSGMIIPLSITFSRAFKSIRGKLCNWGTNWFSSYDISQRNYLQVSASVARFGLATTRPLEFLLLLCTDGGLFPGNIF